MSVYPSAPVASQKKPKDDERLIWLIVGGIFTALLIFIDFGYSSVNEMSLLGKVGIRAGHAIISLVWVAVMYKFKDPNYDYFRIWLVVVTVVLAGTIALHHSLNVEDAQVIIDSHENAAKDTIK